MVYRRKVSAIPKKMATKDSSRFNDSTHQTITHRTHCPIVLGFLDSTANSRTASIALLRVVYAHLQVCRFFQGPFREKLNILIVAC